MVYGPVLEERVLPELLRLHGGERRLRKAAEGMYGEWSFRDAPAWIRRHSERRKDRRFELEPRIRARVTFSCLNLADDAYPSLATNATNAMGVILCRNVPIENALALLRARAHDEILPQSEGLTAGRFAEIVASVLASQPRAAA